MDGYERGAHVLHGTYGLGTIVASNPERTSIDFVDHGTKHFVTQIVVLVHTDEQPPAKKGKGGAERRVRKRASAAGKPKAPSSSRH